MRQPCQNGATCKITGDNSYKCQCMEGFFGTFCEKGKYCVNLLSIMARQPGTEANKSHKAGAYRWLISEV